jgi:hypothetical protein
MELKEAEVAGRRQRQIAHGCLQLERPAGRDKRTAGAETAGEGKTRRR